MKSTAKLFLTSLFLFIGLLSFNVQVYAQEVGGIQTVITDTIKRTAREQTEKAIQTGTQKTLDAATAAGKNLDNNIASNAEKGLAEKVPFIHKNIYLPMDGWRTKQAGIWERMIAAQELDTTGKIPEPIKKVSKTLDTTSGIIPKTGKIDQAPDDEKLFASTDAINDAVAGTSINPEETLGKTYTIFLKLLLIIFNSKVLFYGLFILIVLGILSKILKLRSSE
jgi:hypothetical protein